MKLASLVLLALTFTAAASHADWDAMDSNGLPMKSRSASQKSETQQDSRTSLIGPDGQVFDQHNQSAQSDRCAYDLSGDSEDYGRSGFDVEI